MIFIREFSKDAPLCRAFLCFDAGREDHHLDVTDEMCQPVALSQIDLKSARWGRDPADVVSPLAWIRHTACMQLGGIGIWKKVTGCLTMWQASVICT